MNKELFTPRRKPGDSTVITDKFPEKYPIFWGPNQRILEDDKYVEPSGFVDNRSLIVPKIVRFIYDAHQETVNAGSCILVDGNFAIDVYLIPSTPAFGSQPWAATGVSGSWFPSQGWRTQPVVILQTTSGGGSSIYQNTTAENAFNEGFLIYSYWWIQLNWLVDGNPVQTSFLSNTEPVIVWTLDFPHLLMTIPCSAYPVGCTCP